MTSEQQVILFLSLIGLVMIAIGFWLKADLERTEKRERAEKALRAHAAE